MSAEGDNISSLLHEIAKHIVKTEMQPEEVMCTCLMVAIVAERLFYQTAGKTIGPIEQTLCAEPTLKKVMDLLIASIETMFSETDSTFKKDLNFLKPSGNKNDN